MEKYWIGDLCYVIRDEDWQDFCNISMPTAHSKDFVSGDITLSNGIKVSYQSTNLKFTMNPLSLSRFLETKQRTWILSQKKRMSLFVGSQIGQNTKFKEMLWTEFG